MVWDVGDKAIQDDIRRVARDREAKERYDTKKRDIEITVKSIDTEVRNIKSSRSEVLHFLGDIEHKNPKALFKKYSGEIWKIPKLITSLKKIDSSLNNLESLFDKMRSRISSEKEDYLYIFEQFKKNKAVFDAYIIFWKKVESKRKLPWISSFKVKPIDKELGVLDDAVYYIDQLKDYIRTFFK